ncbi:MAG: F0F1 ATP synthase subunit A [Solirubrobacterales bacterium]|nr:F0F1 ATP synthase subunit A [Solirubrobacterales bacterium]
MTLRRRITLALTGVSALLLTAPGVAAAIEVNKDFKPQNEFRLDPWVSINIGPFDMSINKAVMYLILTCIFTTVTMVWVAKRMEQKPNRVQTAVEAAYIVMRDNIAGGNMDTKTAKRWFSFVATLFLFIWFSNMLGYIPLPTNTEHTVNVFGIDLPTFAIYAATANLAVPLALTLMVWFAYHFEGIRAKGPVRYLKGWVPAGVTGPAVAPIFLIEVISHFVRVVSLSVRLFANILAGHLLILFMGGGLAVLLGLEVVGVFTLPLAIAFYIFEVGLVGTLQAFIFATLASIYFGGAVAEEH